jgi:beta-lactamase regulating signal transducer with metallopeptidase domain
MTAIDQMLQQPFAQAIGWALLQFVWQGTLIAVLTAALLAALRRSGPDVRYVVSAIALALMLTLPVVSVVQTLGDVNPVSDSRGESSSATTAARDAGIGAAYSASEGHAPAPAVIPRARAGWSVDAWLPSLVSFWLAGVVVLTLRLFSGWMWAQRMKSHGARPAPDDLQSMARRLVRRLHIGRPVRLLESASVAVPTVIGWLKPVVLLPASALASLAPDQMEAILAHELAHIRRHDYLVNLLQTVIETLLFYHPAVWWLSRRIRAERENCCDDLAVSLCGDPVAYAAALAELEGLRSTCSDLVLAATGGSLLARVRRLLGAPTHAGRAPGWLAAGLALLVVISMSAGVVVRAALIGEPQSALVAPAVPARAASPAPAIAAGDALAPAAVLARAPASLPAAARPAATTAPALVVPRAAMASRTPTPAVAAVPAVAAEPPSPAQAATAATGSTAASAAVAAKPAIGALSASAATPASGALSAIAATPATRARSSTTPTPASGARSAIAAAPAGATAAPVIAAAPARAAAAPIIAATAVPAAAVAAIPATAAAAPAVATAAAIAATPAVGTQATAAAQARASAQSTSGRSGADGKSGNFVWSEDGKKFEVNYRGDIEFTDDDTDVSRMSPGAYLRIKDGRRFGTDNSVEFRAGGNGAIERRFWVGSQERPFDPEGRKWLAEMLPKFIRQSGIGAAGRVARFMTSGGPGAVLAEISRIEGSWAKRLYFTELFKQPGLTSAAIQQALAQAGREVESDFELASLLIASNRLVTEDGPRRAYLDAARTIGSDFELHRVLSSIVKAGPMSSTIAASVLDASGAIDSDFEQASLLTEFAAHQPLDGTVTAPFFKAASTVSSSFERHRVLTSVLQRADLPAQVLVAALASAGTVDVDFEAASFLVQFLKSNGVEGPARAPFFRAVASIDSAFERGRVLQALARRPDVSDQTVLEILRSAQTMTGGFERAQVLLAVAGSHPLTREARDAYIDASDKLGDFEQGRVLSALVRNERGK